MPEVRHAGPVRRRLRELRRDLRAARPEGRRARRFRARSRCAQVRALLLRLAPSGALRDWLPKHVDAALVAQGRRMVQGRPQRLGHLARRALLRHPDPRRAGQVLLRLARRADRLPRRASRTCCRARRARTSTKYLADPRQRARVHFIGKDIVYFHTLFWPAMLQVRRLPQDAGPRLRARLPHGRRREDVEVARHGHQPRCVPRRSA